MFFGKLEEEVLFPFSFAPSLTKRVPGYVCVLCISQSFASR